MASHSIKDIVYALSPSVAHPFFRKIESSDIGSRLTRGIFWALVGTLVSRGMMLCATIAVARMLGREVYGELGIIQATIGMLSVFAGFGLGLTATKHVAELRNTDPYRAGRIMGISSLFASLSGGVMALSLFIAAPFLAEYSLNAPHLTYELRVGCMGLFISALNGAQVGALSGLEAFKTIARVNLYVGLLSFPLLVAGAYYGGLLGVVWALVINHTVNWFLNHIALRRESQKAGVPFIFTGCGKEWPILWRFSLPAALSGLLVAPVNWASSALLVNQEGGYAEMGLFSAANQWRIAVLFIPGMLGQVILPLLSSLTSTSETREYQKLLKINILLNVGIAVAVVVPLVIIAPYIMKAYGAGFEQGERVLRVLVCGAILIAVNNVVGQAIISKGKMWLGFTFNLLWAVCYLLASYLLINKGYGALGLAYSTLIAYTAHTACQSFYYFRFLNKYGN